MYVMKFGGTSVGSAQSMHQVIQLVKDALTESKKPPVVVLSAMSGITNKLIEAGEYALNKQVDKAKNIIDQIRAHHKSTIESLFSEENIQQQLLQQLEKYYDELIVICQGVAYLGELSKRSLDAISGIGELLSSKIIGALANREGIPSAWIDAREFLITDDNFNKASPLWDKLIPAANEKLLPLLKQNKVVFTQGFIGSTTDGISTTLGRGGSDYSASIIGVTVNAKEIQIWTDVDGMMSADPRIVPNAKLLSEVSFQEASELAYFGAKVLHPLTIKPAVEKNIPVRILNTFNTKSAGTLIKGQVATNGETVRAVATKKGIRAIFLSSPRMLMTHGFLAQVFSVFDKYKVPIDLISTSEISVAMTVDSKENIEGLLSELNQFGEINIMDDVAIVSVVGRQFRYQNGIAGRVFNALKDVNIMVISGGASDINLNFVISSKDADKAIKQLHTEFFKLESVLAG